LCNSLSLSLSLLIMNQHEKQNLVLDSLYVGTSFSLWPSLFSIKYPLHPGNLQSLNKNPRCQAVALSMKSTRLSTDGMNLH
jgi:hypothetical protein